MKNYIKAISMILILILCLTFLGCSNKANEVTKNIIERNSPYPNVVGFSYGMSKDDVFKLLNVKESDAVSTNSYTLSNMDTTSYTFENLTYGSISTAGFTLSFNKRGSTDFGLVSYDISFVPDADVSFITDELDRGYFNKDDVHDKWASEKSIETLLIEKNITADEYYIFLLGGEKITSSTLRTPPFDEFKDGCSTVTYHSINNLSWFHFSGRAIAYTNVLGKSS